MAYLYDKLKPEYSHLWSTCTINPGKKKAFEDAAALIRKGEDRYKTLEDKTGVPWYLIGMLHYRESDCNFGTHLHNGDSLRSRTVHVPRGRPPTGSPPFAFDDSAIDALKYEHFTDIHDWSIERVLYCLEQYNGWGYRARGFPSAYVWAGTSNYHSGKFVSDGVFSAHVVDSQLGCAGILKVLLDELPDEVKPYHDDTVTGITWKAKADVEQIASESRKWSITTFLHSLFGGSATLAAGGAALNSSNIQSTKATLDSAKVFVTEYGIFIFIGVCVLGSILVYLLREYMKQDAAEGRYIPSGQPVFKVNPNV